MLLSLQWLREFVSFEGTSAELAEKLTLLGLEVEEIFHPFAAISSVCVGHVRQCVPHPDSDHLSVCQVDIGQDELLPIVCGAPNVAAGQKVAVAPVGTTMPGGMVIKKAKLRGQTSQGMICSAAELELAQESNGIMVLDDAAVPGTLLVDWLGLETCVFDISITPNRADCLSVLGIARDLSAAFDLSLTLPVCELSETGENCADLVAVHIQDPQACPLYQARVVQGVKVGPSPDWLRYRLLAVGLRPINAVVDITNFMMLETGQPLHAFDRCLLTDKNIFVRGAQTQEKITTLDGRERELTPSDLVIADSGKAIALAGIMGGQNTEITPACQDVLLECAVFDPPTIRKTARRLGLSTDSSFRFERGVDQLGTDFVLNRAASLIARFAGGKIARGRVKEEKRPFQAAVIDFSPQNARDLLALATPDDFCQQLLGRLGCEVDAKSRPWKVVAPSYRLDLEREADLIEEIGRVWGMDKIPVRLPRISKNLETTNINSEFSFLHRVRHWAKGLGLHECINYSFLSGAELDNLGLASSGWVGILNPLTDEQDNLRPQILPGLFDSLRRNLAQGNTRLRFFEVAHTFMPDSASETGVREKNHLALVLSGPRTSQTFPWPAPDEADYLELKGLVEHFTQTFHLLGQEYALIDEHPYLLPAVSWKIDGEVVGILGMLKPEAAERYNARSEVWAAEIDLDALMDKEMAAGFSPLPRFPYVQRDMTLIAQPGLHFATIEQELNSLRIDILEDVQLMDIYTPEGSQEKHLTLRLTYRHPKKTLKDKDVDKVHTHLGQHLLDKLDIRFP